MRKRLICSAIGKAKSEFEFRAFLGYGFLAQRL